MKPPALISFALFACCVTIAACSQTAELSRLQYAPNASIVRDGRATPLSYSVLYSFGEPLQGSEPGAGLINVGGTLYGTTEQGGAYGGGTLFSITTSGTEKVVHSFGGGSDGKTPYASLIYLAGTFYGTTYIGGKYGGGTVFSFTKGTEKVLWSFGSGSDGSGPAAGLIDVNGTLYGTTFAGGKYCAGSGGCGSAFSIPTTGGMENWLWSFGNGSDGAGPDAGLIDVKGTLYGTTAGGGSPPCSTSDFGGDFPGCGTVFSITTSGTENVLYSFHGSPHDGANPLAGLIDVDGTLYGTTYIGGKYCTGNGGCGTVFSVTTSGTENVPHSFGNGTDGTDPLAGLIDVGGSLYGTTQQGGAHDYGTIFKIPQFGMETVLHSFGNGSVGAQSPVAGLIDVKGMLYGTTLYGGQFGDGTVYTQSP